MTTPFSRAPLPDDPGPQRKVIPSFGLASQLQHFWHPHSFEDGAAEWVDEHGPYSSAGARDLSVSGDDSLTRLVDDEKPYVRLTTTAALAEGTDMTEAETGTVFVVARINTGDQIETNGTIVNNGRSSIQMNTEDSTTVSLTDGTASTTASLDEWHLFTLTTPSDTLRTRFTIDDVAIEATNLSAGPSRSVRVGTTIPSKREMDVLAVWTTTALPAATITEQVWPRVKAWIEGEMLPVPEEATTYVKTEEKGVANGVATLGADALIPDAQIPSSITRDVELDAHLNDATDAHDASAISYAGSTNLVATNVEAALDELDVEKPNLIAATTATASATATKVVTVSGWTPAAGDLLALTFTSGNAINVPALSINGGGAKSILLGGTAPGWVHGVAAAGSVWVMRYDGTSWHMMGGQFAGGLASQAEMEAGTLSTIRYMTPQLVRQGVAAYAAPLASPALTGNPTAPTPAAGDNDTSIATTAFVATAVTAARGAIIAETVYNPASLITIDTATASTADEDIDATNLSVTFTVPASGQVRVRLVGIASSVTGNAGVHWMLRTTAGATVAGTKANVAANTTRSHNAYEVRVTGLTPGASVTYRWGHSTSSAVNAGRFYVGDNGAASIYGPASMVVMAD